MKKRSTVLALLFAAAATFGVYVSCTAKAGAVVVNHAGRPISVYIAFGSNSVVRSWPFCSPVPGGCKFGLNDKESQALPTGGQYLNATLSFGGPVTCGMTKVELNINNPAWYDIIDISLVDGFNQKLGVSVHDSAGTHELGPVRSVSGNEKAIGVYPNGCDICVARQSPPCGQPVGHDGCKSGSQYNPDVPCQYQGSVKGGGSTTTITLL
jgi:hypothetical protein